MNDDVTRPYQAPGNTPPERAGSGSGNALPAGTRLGEFELLSVAGEGGFSIVYRAWDHSLQRPVALKEYLPHGIAGRADGLQVVDGAGVGGTGIGDDGHGQHARLPVASDGQAQLVHSHAAATVAGHQTHGLAAQTQNAGGTLDGVMGFGRGVDGDGTIHARGCRVATHAFEGGLSCRSQRQQVRD